MKKYYSIIAKCGHVGANKYIDINFPIVAENEEHAIKLISLMPRVKKSLSNVITRFSEISYDQYLMIKEEFDNNNYINALAIESKRNCVQILIRK